MTVKILIALLLKRPFIMLVKSDECVCHNTDVARVTRIQHVIVNEVYRVG
jgi:hypothetical protein